MRPIAILAAGMSTVVVAALALSIVAASCDLGRDPQREVKQAKKVQDERKATEILNSIRPGMTLSQVQVAVGREGQVVPIQEHGGIWYEFLVDDKHLVQQRFARTDSADVLVVNMPPRLRSRRTQELIAVASKHW